jgi:hypothetical protein
MIKIFLTGLLFIFVNSYSQYTQQWVDRVNGRGNSFDIANNLFLDEQSNAYVYCTVYDSVFGQTNLCAIKYGTGGNILWKTVYDNPFGTIDQLQDVIKDSQNNSYITAYCSEEGSIKILLLKLNQNGDTVFSRITSIPNHETLLSHAICTDNSGNIFILADGRNLTTGKTDFIIVKYNSSGIVLNYKIFEGSPEGDDNGIKILCDNAGNVFAGVNSFYSGVSYDVVIYKLDNNLNEIYTKRINGSANLDDGIVDMKLAYDNNILFTAKISGAGSEWDIGTFKLNNSTGDIIWQKNFNGTGNHLDLPYALTTDVSNNIYVTGYSRNSPSIQSEDIVILKYDKNGNEIWRRIYNDSVNGTDQGFSICTDSQKNIYVAGCADQGNQHVEFISLKYDSLGTLLWKGTYHYYHLSEDFVYKIAVNNNQDIFISGISFSHETDYDVTTIKYARQTGIYSNPEIVKDFVLYPNYPNPFNPSTTISFYNPQKELTVIRIYNIKGEEVAELENRVISSGYHQYNFDASLFSSGVYFYKIQHGAFQVSGKIVYSK